MIRRENTIAQFKLEVRLELELSEFYKKKNHFARKIKNWTVILQKKHSRQIAGK